MGQCTAGDRLFEAYLESVGLAVPEHEPDLGVGKRPDYVVELPSGERCVCEVKEFAATTNSLPGTSASLETVLKPVRSQVHEAARKLKYAASLGYPLVVVLTNPHFAPVFLGDRELVWALEGDPVVRVPTSGPATPLHTVGRNGELREDHQYVSAVAVVHARFPGETPCVAAYSPNSPAAKPLPPDLFCGPADAVLTYNWESGCYERDADPA